MDGPELKKDEKDPEKEFWRSHKKPDVFNQLVQGKSIQDIAGILSCKPAFVSEVVTNPFFLKRLENYLSRIFFNFQVNKILALDEVFKLYWDITCGRKTVEDLTPDQASKHLVKILSLRESQPQVINPKQYNLILNILKADPENIKKNMAEHFGFENLQVGNNERPRPHPQLDKGERDQDEQGSEN